MVVVKHAIDNISDLVVPLGFQRKANTWFIKKNVFLLMFDLQKSQWDDKNEATYYVNAGIQLTNLYTTLPKTARADIQWRISSTEERSLSLETNISLIIKDIQVEILDPILKISTIEEIKNIVIKNPNKYLFTRDAKKILDIPDA